MNEPNGWFEWKKKEALVDVELLKRSVTPECNTARRLCQMTDDEVKETRKETWRMGAKKL